MLNEGYALYRSLNRCGIRLKSKHPDIKKPGKAEGLIVGLDKNGTVGSIEYCPGDKASQLWTIRKGNHGSFPFVKLQFPLLKISQNDSLKEEIKKLGKNIDQKKKLLCSLNGEINPSAQNFGLNNLRRELKDISEIFDVNNGPFGAMGELIKRFLRIENPGLLLEGVLKRIKENQSELSDTLLEAILIGKKWDAKKKEFRAGVPLILDISDWENFAVRVASPKMEQFVSDCLFRRQLSNLNGNDGVGENAKPSALSGEILPLEDDKFPDPNLPLLGNTYLFSVNSNTPCQSRYGKTSTEIIPVGRAEAVSIQNALYWITEEERNGSTWYTIPGASAKKKDLLIVYLENKPDAKMNNAHLLGGLTDNYFSESMYEKIAKIAIDALKGRKVVESSDLIRVFALRKLDAGRVKVSLSRVYTVNQLIKADEGWRKAWKNHPHISMPFFRREIEKYIAKTDKVRASVVEYINDPNVKVVKLTPLCPFPGDLVSITQHQWSRFGKDSSTLNGVSIADIYDVFFAKEGEQSSLIDGLLGDTLQRTLPLLIGLGGAIHCQSEKAYKNDARFTILKVVAALAIYLYKLGIKKEVYMKEAFFLVGQFLSVVDTLHYEYCKHVRGGSVPPQLLGNAHLQIALENPESALELMCNRIRVYQAWARTGQGDNIGLARWALGQLGKISKQLAQVSLPTMTTTSDRAQLLLGYLAKPESKEPNNSK